MLVFGLAVQVEAAVETGFVGIDDGLPCAIQADGGAVGNVVDKRGRIRDGIAKRGKRQQEEEQTIHRQSRKCGILVRAHKGQTAATLFTDRLCLLYTSDA